MKYLYLLFLCIVVISIGADAKRGGPQGGVDFASLLGGLGGLGGGKGGLQFKFHGNYCGMNHGDATYKQEPIDILDGICKQHDQCYDNEQYLDCLCDHSFVTDMKKAASDPYVLKNKLESKANMMAAWFENSACKCLLDGGDSKHLEKANMKSKAKCLSKKLLSKEEL